MATYPYLSLFTGVGGLDCGIHLAFPGARPACYCENSPAAVARLRGEILSGAMPDAPVWDDIATFPGELFRGRVDGIVAGPPCTDYSVAGKRAGVTGGSGRLWNDFVRVVCDVRPRWIALENVRGLLVPHAYPRWRWDRDGRRWTRYRLPAGLWFFLGDLARLGYDAAWRLLSANDAGAAHGRSRIWILAHRAPGGRGGSALADPGDGQLPLPGRRPQGRNGARPAGAVLGNAECPRTDLRESAGGFRNPVGEPSGDMADTGFARLWRTAQPPEIGGPGASDDDHGTGRTVADPGSPLPAAGTRLCGAGLPLPPARSGDCSGPVADAPGPGHPLRPNPAGLRQLAPPDRNGPPVEHPFGMFAPGPLSPLWPAILHARPDLAPALSPVEVALALAVLEGWTLREWEMAALSPVPKEIIERFHGLADGTAAWLSRRTGDLKVLGNSVVPLAAALAFRQLAAILGLDDLLAEL